MKKILFLCMILFVGTAIIAQNDQNKEKSDCTNFYVDDDGSVIETSDPIFKFEMENYDFGALTEGGKHTTEFAFTNVGCTPLIIQGVKASCGCTTPDWPKEPILAGESSVIKATYNTKGRRGPFNKAITITSNSVTPTKRIFIKGAVEVPTVAPVAPAEEKSLIEQDGMK